MKYIRDMIGAVLIVFIIILAGLIKLSVFLGECIGVDVSDTCKADISMKDKD